MAKLKAGGSTVRVSPGGVTFDGKTTLTASSVVITKNLVVKGWVNFKGGLEHPSIEG
jgi:phage baseplate assembly protein gpV